MAASSSPVVGAGSPSDLLRFLFFDERVKSAASLYCLGVLWGFSHVHMSDFGACDNTVCTQCTPGVTIVGGTIPL